MTIIYEVFQHFYQHYQPRKTLKTNVPDSSNNNIEPDTLSPEPAESSNHTDR